MVASCRPGFHSQYPIGRVRVRVVSVKRGHILLLVICIGAQLVLFVYLDLLCDLAFTLVRVASFRWITSSRLLPGCAEHPIYSGRHC